VVIQYLLTVLFFIFALLIEHIYMKKFLLTAAALTCGLAMHAQFGIKGGFNFANFRGDDAKGFNVLTSYHIGASYESHIGRSKHFSIQPELIYSRQGAKVDDNKIELGYFNVPVLLKIYPTSGFNIHLGPQFGMLINESRNFKAYDSQTFDFGLAAGLEIFATDNIFLQARYISGTKNVSGYADIKNSLVQASVGIQF